MKVSVSLPGEDVSFLDAYAREQRVGRVPRPLMAQLDEALRLHLSL